MAKTKNLVVFYSRTGTTRKAAEAISGLLNCDMDEIIDTRDRSGLLGYISAGRDASTKQLAEIKELKKNPKAYETVIIGTPVWAFTLSAPVRTYIYQNKESFKKVAFFCTMAGSEPEPIFREMESLCGKKPLSVLGLRASEVAGNNYLGRVREFVRKIT